MDTTITATARERARRRDGKFGEQAHDRVDHIDLTPAPSTPVTGTADDPQCLDFGLDSVTSARAWYDESYDETTLEVDAGVHLADLIGTDPDDANPDGGSRFSDGEMIARAVIEERYPDADWNGEGDDAHLTFTTSIEGRQSIEDMVTEAMDDPEGIARFHNESDAGSFGSKSLHRLVRDRIDGAVIIDGASSPAYSWTSGDDVDEDGLDEFMAGEQPRPATDSEARTYADMLRMEGAELGRLADHGWGSHAKIAHEIAGMRTPDARTRFAAAQLGHWIDRNNRQVRDRWA